jgi:Anti-sigma factor NepR
MSDFDENKGKPAVDRLSRPPAGIKTPLSRADSTWIGQMLRRRYDSALTEELPESFVALLDELDRKTKEDKPN